jgi:hypothetical protein
VAVYSIGPTAASQLLPPSAFHNAVRNLFANPIQPASGSTALLDSVGLLIDNFHTLPVPEGLVPAIVVISDGTDTISAQYQPDELPSAAFGRGIPVHTIWLNNDRLPVDRRNEGRTYMEQLAAGTGGKYASLTDMGQVNAIWEQIARFRDRTILRYTVTNPRGGETAVSLSLLDNPAVQASASVTLPPGAPTISIDLPPESREMTLVNINDPVTLSFSTTLGWLDGVERNLSSAELVVNGLVARSLDVNRIARFDVTISNFVFGENRVQLIVIDEEGSRAVSPEIILTVNQGAAVVLPEPIRPPTTVERWQDQLAGIWVYVSGCLIVLAVLLLLILLTWAIRRFSILRRLGVMSLLRNIPFLRPYMKDVAKVQQVGQRANSMQGRMGRYMPDAKGSRSSGQAASSGSAARPPAFLEVVEAITRAPSRIELTDVEMRIGRSPSQAEIAFENDITVSRIHSSIVQEGSDYRVYDEQSTAGTWVNEQRVPEYGMQLVDGDEIRVGAVRLRFRQP